MSETVNKATTPTRYVLDGLRSCPKCGKAIIAVKASKGESTTVWMTEESKEMSPHHCEFKPCCVISERIARQIVS